MVCNERAFNKFQRGFQSFNSWSHDKIKCENHRKNGKKGQKFIPDIETVNRHQQSNFFLFACISLNEYSKRDYQYVIPCHFDRKINIVHSLRVFLSHSSKSNTDSYWISCSHSSMSLFLHADISFHHYCYRAWCSIVMLIVSFLLFLLWFHENPSCHVLYFVI